MNNEQRNLMVKRVQEAYAKWPTFDDMPVVAPAGLTGHTIEGDVEDDGVYVAALYELSSKVTPIGRAEKADIIYGKIANDTGSALNIDGNTKQQQNAGAKVAGKRVG